MLSEQNKVNKVSTERVIYIKLFFAYYSNLKRGNDVIAYI